MENIKNQEEKPLKRRNTMVVTFSVCLVFLLGLFVYVLLWGDFSSERSSFPSRKVSGPEGEIYLTLSPLGTKRPNIYKLDLSSMELLEVFANSQHRNYTPHVSPGLTEMVFVRAYDNLTSQLMISDLLGFNTKELTSPSGYLLRNPKFSPDGTYVVYWAYEGEGRNVGKYAEENSIYLVNVASGTEEKVANGAFPLFSRDGNLLLFMKDDGLYAFDLDREEEIFVFKFETDSYEGETIPSWLSFRFDLSPVDNSMLFTDGFGKRVYSLSFESWENFNPNISSLSFSTPIWPVYSPCGDYFAVQQFASEDEQSSFIGVFNLDDFAEELAVTLGDYDKNYIWINDWIIR